MATNEERAERAARVLEAYRTDPTCGEEYPEEPNEDVLTDMLTDLRHWARRAGVSFPNAALRAKQNYIEERNEERRT